MYFFTVFFFPPTSKSSPESAHSTIREDGQSDVGEHAAVVDLEKLAVMAFELRGERSSKF